MLSQIDTIKKILEGVLFAADEPLSLADLARIISDETQIFTAKDLRPIIDALSNEYMGRGIELKEVASGFRFQVREEISPWVNKLRAERPQRYSNALLEILALIAYRQPITRAEIEDIRGVSVSSNIMRTILEREWVTIIGYKEVPGRPALYATTEKFLDYFNLKSIEELPVVEDTKTTGL